MESVPHHGRARPAAGAGARETRTPRQERGTAVILPNHDDALLTRAPCDGDGGAALAPRCAAPARARHHDNLIAIVGATGTGKTDFSLEVASRYRELGVTAEIVNADAMQLYRGMDIGTAKIPVADRHDIPHHQLDVLDVTERSTAATYRTRARADIDHIIGRGNIAILVGGSGLYISAVLHDLDFPATDPGLRAELECDHQKLGPDDLLARLRALDPATSARIDPRNPRQLIRSLEIAIQSGQSVPALPPAPHAWRRYRAVHLRRDREQLFPALQTRAERMFRDGLLDEVGRLRRQGLEAGQTARTAHGYPQAMAVLDGRCSIEDAVASTTRVTKNYSRRQVRWFARYADAEVLDVTGSDRQRLAELARRFVHGPAKTA
ncbi:tRNA (adenosine(37)-N6)-dimethylallyltransferase MiaA [Clavibacter michiganensis subsp. insidiosus]|uniref:tRNA dimethylallyltransferase n=1 Tax=Clavibacter michiganensis subsp. insidiosus TaxID=33014 RepID=A0A399SME6_9MICO|nr:tRNA (adenosine(37)-N6)-dimethylallyltransferase MiaA [Clavibacter michiganensis subsp. insidiosus]RII86120.1 tRNA (adenosine(37)-N6)-dimethylallyltransferase MiaA [Clavibacter michiganensis subsp. insidiosus]RIJ43613.1 tRNA (adenosine(37)-N6)-dimethylallyltransferase MiaA [Clavibacter michiganensis subsp. insidiosus]RMC81927.1 tRNA (adenosine(37)-N6)-dimethylallyltransferase MiaA [Clavibacter michiganensis subsp. insidiosus]